MGKQSLARIVVTILCFAALAPATAFAAEASFGAGESAVIAAASSTGVSRVSVSNGNELLDAIDEARGDATASTPYLIVLEKTGKEYVVPSEKRVPANTIIDLNGQTVTSSANYAFALRGASSSVTNGTLKGTGIRVDVDDSKGSITKLTITDAPAYGIYVCQSGKIGSIENNTIKNAATIGINIQKGSVAGSIKGNTITGCKDKTGSAIYLNFGAKVGGKIANNTISSCKGFGIRLFSKASCGNIEGNKISNVGDCAIQLMGSASAKKNDGSVAGDIKKNTLKKIGAHGISIYHGSHAGKITYNTLDTIGGLNSGTVGDFGITINAGSPYKTYAAEITHNKVSNVTYASIVVFSGPEGDTTGIRQDFGYVAGDIAYNTVNNNATYSKGEKWFDSKDKKPCEAAIYVDSHARVYGSIHHNTVNTSYDDGISLVAYSYVKSIHHNTVNNAKCSGIAVKNYSVVQGAISDNTIKKPTWYGVFVNSSSKVNGKVQSNTITSAGVNGIFASKKSTLATVTKNKVTNTGMYGIAAVSESKIATVSNNTISTTNAKESFGVFVNSKCLISKITGNKITGKYSAGIRVKEPTAKVQVLSNTMTVSGKAKSFGVSVDGCKTKTITIKSNKITGNKTAGGIFVRNSAAVVKGNKVSKSSKAIISSGKYKLTK